MTASRPAGPRADRLVTAASGRDGGRVYHVVAGVKRWIISPDVFRAHGWRFEDVERLPDAEIAAIPTSHVVIGAEPSVADRDDAHLRTSAAFLAGRGMEIGAGMAPQPLPPGVTSEFFELRDPDEVARMESAIRADVIRSEDVPRFRSTRSRGAFPTAPTS